MAKMLAKKAGKLLQCLACNRYCRIAEGQAGFCGVRVNERGRLKLSVYGKPCAVWIDPIEKKPLFHFLPGSRSFSIGTFGCNFACTFCFTPDSAIMNDDSVKSLDELFESCEQKIERPEGEIGLATDRKTITASGQREKIAKVFRHSYEGDVLTVNPRHAPPVTCTPDHRFFVHRNGAFQEVPAVQLRKGDLLAVPKLKPKNEEVVLDTEVALSGNISRIKKMRKLHRPGLERLLQLKKEGKTSRQMGKILGMHSVYLRKLLGQLKKEGIIEDTFTYDNQVVENGGRVRFGREKGDGIPRFIPMNEEFAELLGYYCAEANTHKNKNE